MVYSSPQEHFPMQRQCRGALKRVPASQPPFTCGRGWLRPATASWRECTSSGRSTRNHFAPISPRRHPTRMPEGPQRSPRRPKQALRAKRTPRRQRHISVWYVQSKNECSQPSRKHLPTSGTLAQDFTARTKAFTVFEATSPRNTMGSAFASSKGFTYLLN